MRQITRKHGGASVIPIARAQKKQVRIEMGVDAERGCIFFRMSGTDPTVALTADRAEEMAVDLQNFVYELRNGGKIL